MTNILDTVGVDANKSYLSFSGKDMEILWMIRV